MESILEELYYGNIRPDVRFYESNSAYAEAVRLRDTNKNKLLNLLSEQEKELFEKYTDAQADMDHITRYSGFTYGFKLGMLIITEVFLGRDEVLG